MKMPRFQNLVTACLGDKDLARCLRLGAAAAPSARAASSSSAGTASARASSGSMLGGLWGILYRSKIREQ